MNVLDLFSGIGGFALGLERAGMHVSAFAELDGYCSAVLRKHWPQVANYGDVRNVTAARLRADGIPWPAVICGGFPCQPVSVAGAQLGTGDDRWLWPEYLRVIKECRPTWVIGENVIGIVSVELDNVLADLASVGYSARVFDIPACAVGAHHQRRRVWIVAHTDDDERQGADSAIRAGWHATDGALSHVADTSSERLERQQQTRAAPWPAHGSSHGRDSSGWEIEPAICRVADGIPNRVDRLRALGNAIVPQIAEIIGRAILSGHAQ